MTRIGMAIDPSTVRSIERRRVRRRAIAQVVVAVLALGELGTASWIIQQRSVSTVVAVDDVLADFRDRQDVATTRATAGSPGTSTVPLDPSPDLQGPQNSVVPGVAESQGSATSLAQPGQPSPAQSPVDGAASRETASGEPAPAAPMALALPAEGVYSYDSSGYESISLGGARHDYPEKTHAIVEHGSGCEWSFDHRVVEEKRTRGSYCNDGPVQQALGYQQWLTFYGSTVESNYTCDRGARTDLRDDVGSQHHGSCTDGEGTSSDTVTFLGREPLTVGGEVVETLHYRVDTQLTGNVEGEATQHVWVLPQNALPVRLVRQTDTRAYEFGAQVTYVEEAEFMLSSLAPQR